MNLMQVFALLQTECAKAGGQKAWAAEHGLSGGYVSSVLHAKQDPGPAVLAALGLRKVVSFEPVRGKPNV